MKRVEFDAAIQVELGDSFRIPNPSKRHNTRSSPYYEWHLLMNEYFDPFVGMEDVQLPGIPESDCVYNKGQPILQQLLTDTLINSEVLLLHGEDLIMSKVLRRSMDDEGIFIGNPDDNPLLKTLIYDVDFPDRNFKKYDANVIA